MDKEMLVKGLLVLASLKFYKLTMESFLSEKKEEELKEITKKMKENMQLMEKKGVHYQYFSDLMSAIRAGVDVLADIDEEIKKDFEEFIAKAKETQENNTTINTNKKGIH